MIKLLCLLSLALVPTFAANILTYNDTTVGAPTWNRPVANSSVAPVPPLSGVGTAVAYHAFAFEVDTAALYNILSTATLGWDNYTFLYQTSFNPGAPFNNVLIGNDDNPNAGLSGFSVNLAANQVYVLVTTGFGNTDFGAFSNSIEGPTGSNVSAAPEPSTLGLLSAGALLVVWRRRAQAR
jgi:PEP-CTERM motif